MDEAKRTQQTQTRQKKERGGSGYPASTVVEVLEFEVEPDEVDRFIEADERVWTTYLASCRGFLDKQVWVREEGGEAELQVVRATVWWESMELWKAIPQSELDEVQEQFVKALGGKEYPITKADAFKLRRATAARAASTCTTDVATCSITRPSTK